jgi:hypothetical protein
MIRRPEFPTADVACRGSAVLLRLYRWLGSEMARSRVRRLVLRLESFDLQHGTRFGTRNRAPGRFSLTRPAGTLSQWKRAGVRATVQGQFAPDGTRSVPRPTPSRQARTVSARRRGL